MQIACDGSYSKLVGSGFPHHKPVRSPVGQLPAPAGLAVTLGARTGELDASVPPVYGASLYTWRVTTGQPRVEVQTVQTTAASVTFTGLAPGVIHGIEANAIGTAGPSNWTGPINQMVI